MLLPFGSRRVLLQRAVGRYTAIIGADGLRVSRSSSLICFSAGGRGRVGVSVRLG